MTQRAFGRPFQKGQSGNPGGRPKGLTEVQSLAREHTQDAIKALVRILKLKKTHPSATVAAAQALLDRGWGKPQQFIGIDDVSEPTRVIIEQRIVDCRTERDQGVKDSNGGSPAER